MVIHQNLRVAGLKIFGSFADARVRENAELLGLTVVDTPTGEVCSSCGTKIRSGDAGADDNGKIFHKSCYISLRGAPHTGMGVA